MGAWRRKCFCNHLGDQSVACRRHVPESILALTHDVQLLKLFTRSLGDRLQTIPSIDSVNALLTRALENACGLSRRYVGENSDLPVLLKQNEQPNALSVEFRFQPAEKPTRNVDAVIIHLDELSLGLVGRPPLRRSLRGN